MLNDAEGKPEKSRDSHIVVKLHIVQFLQIGGFFECCVYRVKGGLLLSRLWRGVCDARVGATMVIVPKKFMIGYQLPENGGSSTF